MRQILLCSLFAILSGAVASGQQVDELQKQFSDMETRVAALEKTILLLVGKDTRNQLRSKTPTFDAELPGQILAFYSLEPFLGRIKKFEVIKPQSETLLSKQEDDFHPNISIRGPTLIIEIETEGKTIIVKNFETLPGSKKTIEQLFKEEKCRFPHDIHKMRYSALFD